MDNPSSSKHTQPKNTSVGSENRYDLFDNTIEALEKGLAESKQDAPALIQAWLGPLREEGFPEVAFELENLERAIRGANVPQIRESLVKSARLSESALGKAEGMMRTKLLDMINLLKAAASQFDMEDSV